MEYQKSMTFLESSLNDFSKLNTEKREKKLDILVRIMVINIIFIIF